MRSSALLILLLADTANSVELLRYRGAGNDGGTLEYLFETDEPATQPTASKEKPAENAADFMKTFYHVHVLKIL